MSSASTEYPFKRLGKHTWPVSNSSPAAQLWIDRGLAWAGGYNLDEAIHCFQQASKESPECLVALWAVAAASGPHYNNDAVDYPELAVEVLEKAEKLVEANPSKYPEVEKALVAAMKIRHVPTKPEQTRAELNQAYADAMQSVHEKHGQKDPYITSFFIEALMQLSPWQLWKNGKMADETRIADILQLLDKGLAIDPDHPMLLHFHIHAWEMSPRPETALDTAERLRNACPDSGHLVHMPSHIAMLVGDYARAISDNERAVAVDRNFLSYHGPDGFYTLYRFHDLHLLVYAAMFAGCYSKAIAAALELASTPEHVIAERADWLETFVAVPYHVYLRFGKWQNVLEQPAPKDPKVFSATAATRLFARAVALAALSKPEEAEQERLVFEQARAQVPESRTLFNNTAVAMLSVSSGLALGEVRYRQGKYEEAFEALRKAAVEADNLIYDEPEGQMMPVRHALGALLLEQGQLEEGEQVLRTDLGKHPKNIWALKGLDEILKRTGRDGSEEAKEVERELARLEKIADMPIGATCFCRLSKFEG